MIRKFLNQSTLTFVVFLSLASASFGQSTNYVEKSSIEEELGSAASGVNNPAVNAGSRVVGAAVASLTSGAPKSQGFQFKDPVISPSGTYRYYHDSSTPAGFGGHDWSAEFSLDADIYDGLITGVFYQRLTRNGHNSTGTSEDLDSDSVSLYAAKRFIDLINAGAAYNLSIADHDLQGTAIASLDRTSNGFTAFTGVSDKLDDWFLSSTLSFTYAHDNYRVQPYLDTGLITLANEVSYDVVDFFTLGLAFSYNNFVIQDTFPGVTAVDDDYWMVGPRFRFFPTDELTVSLDLDTEEGFRHYDAYTVRVGCNYAF